MWSALTARTDPENSFYAGATRLELALIRSYEQGASPSAAHAACASESIASPHMQTTGAVVVGAPNLFVDIIRERDSERQITLNQFANAQH